MIADLIDIVESLTLIMQEETARLQGPARHRGAAAIVDAKLRLVAALEVRAAEVARHGDLDAAGPDLRAALVAALAELASAAEPNRAVIARQIELSTEMMDVVAAEARRQSGARSTTYGALGEMNRSAMSAPISVNTSL